MSATVEMLAIEEADAWLEYLEAIRGVESEERYGEIEPWAWARLRTRLKSVRGKLERLKKKDG